MMKKGPRAAWRGTKELMKQGLAFVDKAIKDNEKVLTDGDILSLPYIRVTP